MEPRHLTHPIPEIPDIVRGKYRVVFDEAAGYHRLDPIPTQEEVDRYYAEEFYAGDYTATADVNDSSLKTQDEDARFYRLIHEDIWENVCQILGRRPTSVLDVGCGYGKALLYFRELGAHVKGIEPVPEAVAHGTSLGVDIAEGSIEEIDRLLTERYDFVFMQNVLEHLRDPSDVLTRVKKDVLSAGGVLAVRVPNEFNPLQLLANDLHKLGHWWVAAPQHINYFNTETLPPLFEGCGLQVRRVEGSFPLELFMLEGDVYVGNPSLGKQVHQKRVAFELSLQSAGMAQLRRDLYQKLAELGIGREITVYGT